MRCILAAVCLFMPFLLEASEMNKDATQLAQKAIAKKLVEKPKLEAKSKSEGELARRSSSETKEDNYMKAAVALSGVIAAIAGVASAPVAAGIAVGVIVVTYFVDMFRESNSDMWKKLEEKVEIKIGQKLAAYHVDRLYAEAFRVMERRIRNPDDFNADDFELILDKGHMVFPQNYPSLGWSYDLPLAILNWMPFMIAGYHHMIKKGNQPDCALANELAVVRAKIITGMKEMTRKRYATIHGTDYDYDRVHYDCRKKKKKASKASVKKRWYFRRKKQCVSIDRLMTYDDGLSGHRFTIRKRHTRWIGDSWQTQVNRIRDQTVNQLWKEVVEKVNNYFDPEICLETIGCTCPQKITKDEITFDYPNTCFGNSQCMHPCGRFDYDYDWCYIPRNPDRWIKCNRINWDQCWPIYTPEVTPPNVFPEEESSQQPENSEDNPGDSESEDSGGDDEGDDESEGDNEGDGDGGGKNEAKNKDKGDEKRKEASQMAKK